MLNAPSSRFSMREGGILNLCRKEKNRVNAFKLQLEVLVTGPMRPEPIYWERLCILTAGLVSDEQSGEQAFLNIINPSQFIDRAWCIQHGFVPNITLN